MSIWDIFRSAETVSAIFKLGYIPEKDEFYELTPEQYKRYYETMDEEPTGEKIFMLLPKDAQKYIEIADDDVYVFTETDIERLVEGEELINRYCTGSKKPLKTFEDKLRYAASVLPEIFSEGTKYERTRMVYLDPKNRKK
jgi:hypothetical protein